MFSELLLRSQIYRNMLCIFSIINVKTFYLLCAWSIYKDILVNLYMQSSMILHYLVCHMFNFVLGTTVGCNC